MRDSNTKTSHQELMELPYDVFETNILQVARYLFVGLDQNAKQDLTPALKISQVVFGWQYGQVFAKQILTLINDVLQVRSSEFNYHCPNCAKYRMFATQPERYLINSLHFYRRQNQSIYRSNALLLCEGGDSSAVFKSIRLISTTACQIGVKIN